MYNEMLAIYRFFQTENLGGKIPGIKQHQQIQNSGFKLSFLNEKKRNSGPIRTLEFQLFPDRKLRKQDTGNKATVAWTFGTGTKNQQLPCLSRQKTQECREQCNSSEIPVFKESCLNGKERNPKICSNLANRFENSCPELPGIVFVYYKT